MNPVYIVIALVIVIVVIVVVLRSRKPSQPAALEQPPVKPPPRVEPSAEKPVAARPEAAKPETAKPAAVAPAVEPHPEPLSKPAAAEEVPIEVETPAAVAPSQPLAARALTPEESKRDVAALKKGLQSTRGGWVQRLVGLFGGKKEIDPQLLEQVQEVLLTGDVGPKTTERLIEMLKARLEKRDLSDPETIWTTLRECAREILQVDSGAFGSKARGKPLVVLVVGVNGVGKTTTIGKLASKYKEQGKSVYLAAGDTFRAAAVAQLEAWGKRVGVPVVKGKDLSKPSAVVFDAVQTGAKEGADIVIADTAGRLHTKTPLMDELRKLRDAATKAHPGAPHEILLVLDATTGQNGIVQVKEFREALDLTGIVLTKLDGTAKGGVILGICDEFKLPVRFVGVGEKVDDLREFNVADFTEALFSRPGDDETAAA